MTKYYKYNRKSKNMDNRNADYVGQMLNKKRDGRFALRLPGELETRLNEEDKPANVVIKLLAEHYGEPFDYDPKDWEEETKNW